MSQFLHEASIGSPEKPTYGNKKAKKSGHCETKEKKETEERRRRWKLLITQKKKMHATLKLNKFHSLIFAGQTRYTIPEITWLYPQEKFLLRSTSRYTYVLCIVYKCWCSCERGIFVWRESHPRKKKGKFGYLYNYIFTPGAYHIRMMRLHATQVRRRTFEYNSVY